MLPRRLRGAVLCALLLGAPLLGAAGDPQFEQLHANRMPLADVARELAQLTGRTVVLGQGVTGDVTLAMGTPADAAGRALALSAAIEAAGYALAERGPVLALIQRTDARHQPGEGQWSVQVLTLRHRKSADVVEAVRSSLGTAAVVQAVGDQAVLVGDGPEGIERARRIVGATDVVPDMGVELVKLRHQRASEVAQGLQGLFQGVELRAMEPTNTVVIAGSGALRSEIRNIIRANDKAPGIILERRHAVRGDVGRVVQTIRDSLGMGQGDSSLTVSATDKVLPAPDGKAVLFVGRETFVNRAEALLALADVRVPSVTINAAVVEVSRQESRALGLQLAALGQQLGASVVTGGGGVALNSAGLVLSGSGNLGKVKLAAVFDLLDRSSAVKIVQRPSIRVSSGEQASIEVGDEIPVPTGRVDVSDTGAQRIREQYDRRTVGAVLRVRPVIEGGSIRIEMEQELSAVGPEVGDRGVSISKRSARTVLDASSGEVVWVGGLSKTATSATRSGVPGGEDVPFLDFLFGGRRDGADDTELMVFLSCELG